MKSIHWLLLGALGAASCADIPDGSAPAGPTLTVAVAALNLVGVGDVVWDLEVVNGGATPQTVWQRRVSSSGYGDGAGSASYVGTCDAGANPNTVRVWVVGVYGAAVADAGTFDRGATDGAGAVTGTPLPFENPTAAGPLTRDVICAANGDVAVQFDVALMRPAQQGFFDIAISFNDVFCSAEFDCCDDANTNNVCDPGEDLDLLFTPGAGRGLRTARSRRWWRQQRRYRRRRRGGGVRGPQRRCRRDVGVRQHGDAGQGTAELNRTGARAGVADATSDHGGDLGFSSRSSPPATPRGPGPRTDYLSSVPPPAFAARSAWHFVHRPVASLIFCASSGFASSGLTAAISSPAFVV